MPDQTVRFTPDELKALIESGDMTYSDILRLNPQDHATAKDLFLQHESGRLKGSADLLTGGMATAEIPGLGALASKAKSMLPGMNTVIQGGKYAGQGIATGATLAGTNYALRKAGVPPEIADMISLGMAFGHKPGGAAPAAAEVEGAAGTKINPTNVSRGRTMDPLQASPGGETYEQVQRGVQNDFRGPVGINSNGQRGWSDINLRDAYPSNIKTESNMADLLENILGTSRVGRTPMQFQDPALRNSIDRLREPLKRRTPGQ